MRGFAGLSVRLPLLAVLVAASSLMACSAETTTEDGEDAEDALVEAEGKPVISAATNRLVDVPFYFTIPKDAVSLPINRRGYSYPTVWNPSTKVESSGLRVIAINQKLPKRQVLPARATPEQLAAAKMILVRANTTAKKAARKDMSKQLAQSGVLQDGDIVLSFRPENASTVPYMHIQMGSTHASLTYLSGGVAKNVDAPMDNEYIGAFDAHHFSGGISSTGSADLGTDALHIVRPKKLANSPERRASLNFWATKAAANRANGKVKFNKEYLAPSATTVEAARKLATNLGRAILGLGGPELQIFCSEFAYHMLALSSCKEADIRSAGPEGAACVDVMFSPMPMVGNGSIGLGEGPLATILGAPAADRAGLVETLFMSMDAANMSSGHRATAEATGPLMVPLKGYYQGRSAGLPANAEQLAPAVKGLNGGVQPNYSPTAFFANASQAAGVREMDYVATVVFVDGDADYKKAKSLSAKPVP